MSSAALVKGSNAAYASEQFHNKKYQNDAELNTGARMHLCRAVPASEYARLARAHACTCAARRVQGLERAGPASEPAAFPHRRGREAQRVQVLERAPGIVALGQQRKQVPSRTEAAFRVRGREAQRV